MGYSMSRTKEMFNDTATDMHHATTDRHVSTEQPINMFQPMRTATDFSNMFQPIGFSALAVREGSGVKVILENRAPEVLVVSSSLKHVCLEVGCGGKDRGDSI